MTLTLTKTRLVAGVWDGVLKGAGDDAPTLRFTHLGEDLPEPTLTREGDTWRVSAAVPADRIGDGIQTFLISEAGGDTVLAHFTIVAGEALAEDLRADVDLLRQELDLLKRAFRRHCAETAAEGS